MTMTTTNTIRELIDNTCPPLWRHRAIEGMLFWLRQNEDAPPDEVRAQVFATIKELLYRRTSAQMLTLDDTKEKTGKWLDPRVCLPPEGLYVLVRHTRGTWKASDAEGCEHVVACRTGPDFEVAAGGALVQDKNGPAFYWQCFGQDRFSAATVCAWMYFDRGSSEFLSRPHAAEEGTS